VSLAHEHPKPPGLGT